MKRTRILGLFFTFRACTKQCSLHAVAYLGFQKGGIPFLALPSLPSLPLPYLLPPLPFSLPFPLPIEVGALNPARGSGEAL